MAQRQKSKRGKPRPSPPTTGIAAGALVAITFVTALSVRLLYLDSIREAPFFSNLQSNALRYHQWASLILDGPRAPLPPFDQPPGYAYFIALVYAACGRSVAAVATVQALLDACTCALIAHLTRVWFGSPAAVIAALLATLCAPLIYFSAEMLPATLSLAIAVAAVTAALHSRWLAAGSLWGLGLTLRAEMVLALPFVALDAAWRGARTALLRTLAPVALVVAVFITANALASGHFVPLTLGGGLNLWLGNNQHADGVNPFVFGPLAEQATQVRAQAGDDSVVADSLFRQRAFAFWSAQPRAALALLLKKFLWTWSRRELPNSSDIEWQTAHSWLFANPFFPIGFGMLLPAAVAGMVLARRRLRQLLPAVALLAVGIGTCTLFFTNARFRLIVVPALICLAAHWLSELPRLRRGSFDHVSFVGLLIGFVLAWGNFYGVHSYWIPQISANTGILEREAGRLPAAARDLRRAVGADPGDAIAWGHLALALEQMGLVDDALDAYLDGLSQTPDSEDLRRLARRAFARHRLPQALLDEFLEARDAGQRTSVATNIHAALDAARRPPP